MADSLVQPSLNVALKEWDTVCRALETGRQIVLLRKGGIHEAAGEFEVDHRQFVLFPTFLHQSPEQLKTEAHATFERRSAEPDEVTLSVAGIVTDVIQLAGRSQVDAIDAEHVWAAPLIDMRFNYRPQNPLYLLIVRAFKLIAPVAVENTPALAGCKSWVPLGLDIPLANAVPVLDDARFEQRRMHVRETVAAAPV